MARELLLKHSSLGVLWNLLGVSLGLQGKDALPAFERAAALMPRNAQVYQNLGNALQRTWQLHRAVESYRYALALDPDLAIAHSNLASALQHLGRSEEAVVSCQRALQIDPDYAEASNGLGNALRTLGRIDDAIMHYRRALEIKPTFAISHINLGYSLLELGRFSEARGSFRQAMRLRPELLETTKDLRRALSALECLTDVASRLRLALNVVPMCAANCADLMNALIALDESDRRKAMHQLAPEPNHTDTLCEVGNQLVNLGRIKDAIVCYLCAVNINDRCAEAFSKLGDAQRLSGQYSAAVESCRRALRIQSTFAEGHNHLGMALQAVGQHAAAIVSYREAITLNSKCAEANNNLGLVLREQGRLRASERHLRRALRLKRGYVDAYINLGMVLRLQHKPREAEISFIRALELDSGSARSTVCLAELRADQGRFAQAEELYIRALALTPGLGDAVAGVIYLRKMTSDDEVWLKIAERAAELAVHPHEQSTLRYAIGKYWDDVGDYERAFDSYRRANELAKQIAPKYERARQHAAVDRVILRYGREWAAATQIADAAPGLCVLVVGMPRSGTSLVEQMLSSHPAVSGAGEQSFWYDVAPYLRESADVLRRRYLRLLRAQAPEASRIVDKLPSNFMRLGMIFTALPNVRVIHVTRNPLDTCLSIFFQRFSQNHTYANDLNDLAHFYSEYRRLMEHWKSTLPGKSLLEVPYEQLVQSPEPWIRDMLKFIALPWNPACLEYHRNRRPIVTASRWQVRQQISWTSIERWRNYEPFVQPLLRLVE